MSYYNSNGELRYSLKEKVAYHNQCANSGKDAKGNKLSFTERVNHSKAAASSTRKLGKFARAKDIANRQF